MATEFNSATADRPQPAAGETPEKNWASLAGSWEIDGSHLKFKGAGGRGEFKERFGIARCSNRFRDGTISAQITLSRASRTAAGIAIGFHSINRPYVVLSLGSFDRAYSILEFRPEVGWESIDVAGQIQNLQDNHPYAIEIRVEGQKARMTVDDVDVLDSVLRHPLESTGLCLYAYDTASVSFDKVTLSKVRPKVFVAMPFREPFDTLYREVIEPVASELNFEMVRVDEIFGPGIILDDIRRQIASAHVMVAEVTTPNPNVFYELGYAHALDKPAILLARRANGDDLPFDIRGYRVIYYDDSIGGKKKVDETLRKHLQAVQHDF